MKCRFPRNTPPSPPEGSTWGAPGVTLGEFARLTILLLVPALGLAGPARGTRGMVAADNALASAAGAEALRDGGDAVDAAVVCALVLGVVQPFGSGIGGGGFAVVHRAGGKPFALDFREVAPAKATRDMFLDAKGDVVEHASTRGPRAAGVPAEVAGLYELHRRHGKLPWKRAVEPALRYASDGFPAGELLHERVTTRRARIAAESPQLAAVFLPGGEPVAVGATVRWPDLARTLAAVAERGADGFYKGDVATRLAKATHGAGGLITEADLAAYTVKERPLVDVKWRGYRVLSMPPPSSGGAVVLQVLRVLEHVDLKKLGHNSDAYLHRLAETLKHAFADRARVMGDPDFAKVPVDQMLSDATVARVRAAFDPDKTLPRAAYGSDYGLPDDGGTSHFSIVDAAGNAVALTSTMNTSFGSLFVAGDTGVLLNNQMDDFVSKPGVPNAYGLIGREANTVRPGKRPLSSMSPTVVLDGRDHVVLVLGGSGGPAIITGTVQVLLNVLVFGMDVQAAVEAPRIHHQWVPEILFGESANASLALKALRGRGHEVKRRERFNAVQVVGVTKAGQTGASDPSKKGKPAAAD